MKKQAFILLSFFLFGCGNDIEIPEKYAKNPAKFEITRIDSEHKGSAGHRFTVYVDANVDAQASPSQRAAAAFLIAMEAIAAQKMADIVYVTLHDPKMSIWAGSVTRLQLTPDGCTFSNAKEHCNGATWTLNNSNKTASGRQRRIDNLWHGNRADFQSRGVTDDDALIEYIAKELDITSEDVSLFNYVDYENQELFK